MQAKTQSSLKKTLIVWLLGLFWSQSVAKQIATTKKKKRELFASPAYSESKSHSVKANK